VPARPTAGPPPRGAYGPTNSCVGVGTCCGAAAAISFIVGVVRRQQPRGRGSRSA
jgi:hypothetical protein